jgi:hypothetical protein
MYVGGNRNPGGDLRCQRESPTLSHEEWVCPGIEPTTSEVTGADVKFRTSILPLRSDSPMGFVNGYGQG